MRRAVAVAWLLGLLAARPLSAQEAAPSEAARAEPASGQLGPVPGILPPPADPTPVAEHDGPAPALPWQTAWGLVGIRIIPAGPRIAPNGQEYHPNFSIDLNFNCWIWQSQRLYLASDLRFWGEKGELGVTNGRDGALGTSKREFDLSGGLAWNYAGFWEARVIGYSYNNLNRGDNPTRPAGFNDGFLVENRYYLSAEYARLGQTGFDVTRANFLSVGFYPSKEMIGNDGKLFKPGLLLRAYVTQDLWDWPVYAFGDVSYLSERSLKPRLILFDLGFAARPFARHRQVEFRLGVESTGDVQVGNVMNLWYGSVRYIF